MATQLPDTLLPGGAPVPVSAPARRARRWTVDPEIVIPAAVLLVIIGACFLWPLVGPVPPPVGGSILNAGLPAGGHASRAAFARPAPAPRFLLLQRQR